MPARTLILVLAGVAVAVVLFLVLRPEGQQAERLPATGTATEPATTAGPATTPEETTTAPPEPEAERIVVRVRDGQVEGGLVRATVSRGDRVVFVVRSDVADHVHLHGYDLLVDVVPGRTARIRFRATETGRFEVELEDRALPIAEIEVRP